MASEYYLDNIDLQNGAKTLTAVCVPKGYEAGPQATIILFLHGINQTSIRDYLKQPDHNLQAVLDSPTPVKQVILIAPTLSKDARGGKLGGDDSDSIPSGALSWYLPRVSAELQKRRPDPPITDFCTPDKVSKIVLAAHSGGGKVMLALARTMGEGDYADKIAECWGFDCLYGQPRGHVLSNPTAAPDAKAAPVEWATWETKNRAHREMLWADCLGSSALRFFLVCATGPKGGGTATRSTNLEKLARRRQLSNVHIDFDATATHDGLLKDRFLERLNALAP